MIYKIVKKQNNNDMCVVCGDKNPFSLNTKYYCLENNMIVGLCNGKDIHASYPNRMHGGMICALLDETIGRAVQVTNENIWGVTIELNITYRKPTPLNQTLKCVAKITELSTRTFKGVGFIETQDGIITAQAQATYVILPVDKIVNGEDLNWYNITDSEPIQSIEIQNTF